MINLILDKDKERIRREYRFRVFVVFSWLILVALVVTGVGLGALYLAVLERGAPLEGAMATAAGQTEAEEFNRLDLEIKATREKIKILNYDRERTLALSAILERLLAHRGPGITWRGLFYQRSEATADQFILDGTAATRQQFLELINRLKSDEKLTDIQYPISNLINERDVKFLITLGVLNHEAK